MSKKIPLLLVITISIFFSVCMWYIVNIFGNKITNSINPTLLAKGNLQEQDFKISGLYLKQPVTEVIKLLGKPIKVKTITNEFNKKYNEYEYYYPGIIVVISEFDKKVSELRVESKEIKTFRGIGIGYKEEDVYYHYGKIEKLDDEVLSYKMLVDNMERLYYSLDFHIKNGKVSKIMIYSIAED